MLSHREDNVLAVAKNNPNRIFSLLAFQDKRGLIKPEDAREFQKHYAISSHYYRTYPLIGSLVLVGIAYPITPRNIPGAIVTAGLAAWLGTKVGNVVARNSTKVQRAEEAQNAILSKYVDLVKDPKIIFNLDVLKR
jgi:hypothetical protein